MAITLPDEVRKIVSSITRSQAMLALHLETNAKRRVLLQQAVDYFTSELIAHWEHLCESRETFKRRLSTTTPTNADTAQTLALELTAVTTPEKRKSASPFTVKTVALLPPPTIQRTRLQSRQRLQTARLKRKTNATAHNAKRAINVTAKRTRASAKRATRTKKGKRR